jgi:hypothetical protein
MYTDRGPALERVIAVTGAPMFNALSRFHRLAMESLSLGYVIS